MRKMLIPYLKGINTLVGRLTSNGRLRTQTKMKRRMNGLGYLWKAGDTHSWVVISLADIT